MTAVPTVQRMTAQEFMALPPDPKGFRPVELVEGELVVHAPRALHGDIQRDLLLALHAWLEMESGRGVVALPRDVRLDEGNVFEPDVLWYREGRAPGRHDPPPYPLPDIAVEVRSPSTWRYDVGAKKAAYERHGLPELWLVDSVAEEMLVYRRSTPRAGRFDVALELCVGDTLESPLLPGFALAVAAIYPE
jgi:Uma2 family endonuclease